MTRSFYYLGDCASLDQRDVPELHRMIDEAVEVTYKAMRQAISGKYLDDWARDHGYDTGNERGGLRLSRDWHVSYHRSTWKGRRCYFLVWSAYECIWIDETAPTCDRCGMGHDPEDAFGPAVGRCGEATNEEGQTPEEWLADLFEFELCEECGGDADEHVVCGGPFGNYFARCTRAGSED